AFVKRHHFGRPFGIGTMMCWDIVRDYGGGIYVYDPNQPGAGAREVFRRDDGVIFDMSLSYDARKLLFSWRSKDKKDSYHIYEIGLGPSAPLGAGGGGLRQLTTGRYHDVHPFYLPDGRIGFASTRVESYSMCQPGAASALFVMDADGTNIRRIEYGTLGDYSPFVLDDGSVLFMRWEYQDKNLTTLQGLWTINPDGTRVALFYGNTITIPCVTWQAKPIPGTGEFICTLAPHHGHPVGAIGIIDRRFGLEAPASIRNITPEVPYRPSTSRNFGPGDRQYPWSYCDPYPLAKDLFLVSYGGQLNGGVNRYRIYLMNDRGEKTLLYDDPKMSCFNPIPLVPRPRPHRYPSASSQAAGEGTFVVQDVYQGLTGVKRGEVKALRVMTTVPKRTNMRGRRAYDMDPLIGRGTYYVKQCYGTVPVEPDGSAHFLAPAGTELYFSALDADGKELCRMGSVTQAMPGECQGCIGCHEPRDTAPTNRPVQALRRGPSRIAPPPWGAGPVDFVRHVQPVFDRYCVKCHSGHDPKAGMDLSGDKTQFFNMAYDNLIDRGLVDCHWLLHAPTGVFLPLKTGARVSKLTKQIEARRGKTSVDDESRRRVYTWIEANVPYYATYEHTRPGTPGSRDAWAGPWFKGFQKTYQARCAACHGKSPKATWINLTRPELSRVLNAPLAKAAGGLELCKAKGKGPPARFAEKTDADYLAMLEAIRQGADELRKRPRVDMPDAKPLPYPQDFGKLFSGFAGP
ncbi:MAG: hypothetical protein WBF17_07630, partial [Phycisphaerae bacterium]